MAARRPGRGAPRRWGWHPLRPEWAALVVEASPARRGDLVVDLGAGDGALTDPLADLGCRVLAVEVHPQRAARLRERFAGTRVAVIERDIEAFRWPGHPFRVVANPPYDGINALVRHLLGLRQLRSADLLVADATARGLLERASRYDARLRLGLRVPRAAFRHPPPADARVLQVRPGLSRRR